jgi:hypothetical protein
MLLITVRRMLRLSLALLLAACSSSTGPDDDGGTGYFIRYQANGTSIEYRDALLIHGVITTVGSQHLLAVEGVSPSGTISGSSVNVSVMDVQSLAPGTYVGFQAKTGGFTSASILYRTGGVEFSNTSNSDNRVVIAEISSTEIRGTFSGTVRASGQSNVSITNGEFFVPRRS